MTIMCTAMELNTVTSSVASILATTGDATVIASL